MKQYIDLINHVLANGVEQEDRTGVGTIGAFGYQMRFDLSKGFPLVTTKKTHMKSIIYELLWMLRGDTNIKYLTDNGVSIWNEWADENGDLGPVYGAQFCQWPIYKVIDYKDHQRVDGNNEVYTGATVSVEYVNQWESILEEIKTNRSSRRLLVSAWNVSELADMALAPCHSFHQFKVIGKKLHCQLYQRSADIALGVPFNIASYALLTMIMAQQAGLEPGDFIWTGGDVHIYKNHVDGLKMQAQREPHELPTMMILKERPNLHSYEYEDFMLMDYTSHEPIKFEVAV